MTFINPLHQLPLRDGMRAVSAALADWAILQVDPVGILLPSWRLRSLQHDPTRRQLFAPQNKYQQFQCFHDTSKWCGVLLNLSHQWERIFHPVAVEHATQYLSFLHHLPLIQPYPYTQARAWRHPTEIGANPIIGWVTEHMTNQDPHNAELFIQHLSIHWLNRYTLEELPTNSYDPSREVQKLRGYVLYSIAMNFEHRQIDTPEECEQL